MYKSTTTIRTVTTTANTSINKESHCLLTLTLYRNLLRLTRLYDNYPLLYALYTNPIKQFNPIIIPPYIAKIINEQWFNRSKYYIRHNNINDNKQQYNKMSELLKSVFYKNSKYNKLTLNYVQDCFFVVRMLSDTLYDIQTKIFNNNNNTIYNNVIKQLQSSKTIKQTLYALQTQIHIHPLLQHVSNQLQYNIPDYINMKHINHYINDIKNIHLQPGMFLLSQPKIGYELNTTVWSQSVMLLTYVSDDNIEGIVVNKPIQTKRYNTEYDIRIKCNQMINKNDKTTGLFTDSVLCYAGPQTGDRIIHNIDSLSQYSNQILYADKHNNTDNVYIVRTECLNEFISNIDVHKHKSNNFQFYCSYSAWSRNQLLHELQDNVWLLMTGNSKHVYLNFTPQVAQNNTGKPIPVFDNDCAKNNTQQCSKSNSNNNTTTTSITSIPYNKLWSIGWYNHSYIGKYFAMCPSIKNNAMGTQHTLFKSTHTIQYNPLDSKITGHTYVKEQNQKNLQHNDNDNVNDNNTTTPSTNGNSATTNNATNAQQQHKKDEHNNHNAE